MYKTRNEMKEDICILLGGRVAEQLVLEDISTGASNDIERATKIARAMVTRYGFSEKLGTMVYGKDQNEVFLGMDLAQDRGYSEQVAAMIDEEIRSLIDTAYDQATEILKSDMDKLHELAEYLKKNEKIDGETFEKLMKGELSPKQPEEAQNEETTGAQEAAAPDQDQQSNQ